ncbi:type II toxin-antitoxin system RelE/ParE family toxin [Marinibacterium profundimaris]|uniref:Plasmid stabilization protein ParE n=1 Tax=Marinibacterium profundimaris TaxID=1679460 RepID=A0A225NF93_9RHOB|nr:type II toxin-antitoxin system RelE/ParE family toxin [Marinibacterium profundimaris]OWU68072.1 plasmid stabilization protein ParE [Marinibacterium profundimaris]
MSRTWVLTRQAEAALEDIADWTWQTFGPRQAELYAEDLIAHCSALADGMVHSRSCRALLDPDLPEDLRFARMGRHYIVFIEEPARIVIVDLLHVSSDLPRRLAERGDGEGRD